MNTQRNKELERAFVLFQIGKETDDMKYKWESIKILMALGLMEEKTYEEMSIFDYEEATNIFNDIAYIMAKNYI